MKKITGIRIMGILVVGSLALVALVSCATPPSAAQTTTADTVAPAATDVTNVDENGNTSIDQAILGDALSSISPSAMTLSDAEAEGILYMREEEKLARDVYLTLYEKWGLPIFQNVAASEQTHMDAVGTLIERYGLDDPIEGQDIGAFTNQTLQGLYDQLVDEGAQSLASALRVGAAIEEIDILDLEDWMAQTDHADITLVYENLTKGSRNHLRSFVSTLERQAGETYQPQYLDQVAYGAIIGSAMERGRRGG